MMNMRKNALIFGFLLLSLFSLRAQLAAPLREMTFEERSTGVFIQSFTGVPIVQTMGEYIGLHPVSMDELWRTTRSAGAIVSQAIDSDVKDEDYTDIYGTPLVYLGGHVMDARSGKKAVDGVADGIKRFLSYYILPELDLILIELGTADSIKLVAVDPFTSEKRWSINLREQGGLAQAMSQGSTRYSIPPRLTASGDLAYQNGKYLALIDPRSGALKWNEKLDPAYIFTNPAGTRIVVAEARGGLGGMMTASAADGAPVKFGKTIQLLDAATGQKIWKRGLELSGNVKFMMLYGDDFIVVHDEGMNIFSFTSGENDGRWKRDYSANEIKNVVPQEDGLMVYFKNKRMLIDSQTGEEKWKRSESLEKEPPAWVMAERSSRLLIDGWEVYTRGNTLFMKKGAQSLIYEFGLCYIDQAESRVITVSIEDPDATNIGATPYILSAINLSNPYKPVSTRISMRKGLTGIDPSRGGYFVYNSQSFVLMSYAEATGWKHVADKFYRDPAAAERLLANTLIAAGYVRAQTSATVRATEAVVSNDEAAFNSYRRRMQLTNDAANLTSGAFAKQDNSTVDEAYAYFFARNDQGRLALHKVDKHTGQEVKEFPFDDTTPLYEVDNINSKLYYLVGKSLKIFGL